MMLPACDTVNHSTHTLKQISEQIIDILIERTVIIKKVMDQSTGLTFPTDDLKVIMVLIELEVSGKKKANCISLDSKWRLKLRRNSVNKAETIH